MLTIYIPTYNRSGFLDNLLQNLIIEVDKLNSEGFYGYVNIIVSNNASTDETAVLLHNYSKPFLEFINLPRNIGGDKNIRNGFNSISTGYLWILGDDDLPQPGLVGFIVRYLVEQTPDILALNAKWVPDIKNPRHIKSSISYSAVNVSSLKFVKLMNVTLTFISAFVINIDSLNKLEKKIAWDFVEGSTFEQLAPYTALLLNSNKFVIVTPSALIATGNSLVSYSLVNVFGVILPKIIKSLFIKDSRLSEIFISRLLTSYLPVFIYSVKFKQHSISSNSELPWDELKKIHSSFWAYWLFVAPLRYLPKAFALIIVAVGRSVRRVNNF